MNITNKLATVAAIAAASVGGAAIASAATSGTTTSGSTAAGKPSAQKATPSHDPSKSFHTLNGRSEKLLTGDTESKVKAAALAKVSGTVERIETNIDSSAPYEAHIRKADGTEVEVQVKSDFTVAAVNQMGMGGPGGQHP